MGAFRIIKQVMLTEARLFARSWVFRFHGMFAILGLGIALTVFFIPSDTFSRLSPWMLRAVPSSVPYFTVLILTVFQSLIVMIGAVESLRSDFINDTTQSIHARNFTNISYIAGKALGLIAPVAVLDLLILALVLVVNGVFMEDVPVVWQAYLIYPFIIALPALVFVTGLSLAVAGALRHVSFAMLILLGFLAVPFIWASGTVARILDYNAMHLPLLYSDFVGFGNTGEILFHRGSYVLLGLGLILLSGIRFKRLSQSTSGRIISVAATTALMAAGITAGVMFVAGIAGDRGLRAHMQVLNEEYVQQPRARLIACHLDIEHQGRMLTAEADLTLMNHRDRPLDSICLSLNPGYEVTSVSAGGQSLDFTRKYQIINIMLPAQLVSGDSLKLQVAYHGTPDDRAMYPDIAEADHAYLNRLFTHVIDKRHAFVIPHYLLLTPESLWYPVSGIPYGLVFPEAYEKDFIDFTLELTTRNDLTVISQGMVTSAGNGQFRIKPDTKLPGLTLIVGDYEERSLEVDGLALKLYIKPEHDYFSSYFEGHEERIRESIAQLKENIEYDKGMPYPYRQFMVIETPVQFYAYERGWRTYYDTVQPQMALLPEKGCFLNYTDFRNLLDSYRRYFVRQGRQPDPEQMFENMRRSLFEYVFISDHVQRQQVSYIRSHPRSFSFQPQDWLRVDYMPGYTMSAQFWPFFTSFESSPYPVVNSVMEFYRKQGITIQRALDDRRHNTPLLDEEIAAMALSDRSFEEFIGTEMDIGRLNQVFMLKATRLFSELTGCEEFDTFIDTFIASHAFESVMVDDLGDAVMERYGLDFLAILDDWYHEQGLPLFNITEPLNITFEQDGKEQFQTGVTITNLTPVKGIVCVDIQFFDSDPETRYITFEGNQTKQIGFVTAEKPWGMFINTIMSQNLPLYYHMVIGEPNERPGYQSFDGVRELPYQPLHDDPDIIVVDNLDKGFRVVQTATGTSGRDRDFYGFDVYPGGYICSILSEPPVEWGKSVFAHAYGPIRTAHYCKHGPGNGEVCWTADIRTAGTYDLEFAAPDFSTTSVFLLNENHPDFNRPLFGEYTLTISSAGYTDEATFVPSRDGGWQYVGTFELEPGEVTISLTNETNGVLIYADAIKWVKR